MLIGVSAPEFRICDEKRSTILLAREQPGFGLRAGNTAEDIFVCKFVCSGSEFFHCTNMLKPTSRCLDLKRVSDSRFLFLDNSLYSTLSGTFRAVKMPTNLALVKKLVQRSDRVKSVDMVRFHRSLPPHACVPQHGLRFCSISLGP